MPCRYHTPASDGPETAPLFPGGRGGTQLFARGGAAADRAAGAQPGGARGRGGLWGGAAGAQSTDSAAHAGGSRAAARGRYSLRALGGGDATRPAHGRRRGGGAAARLYRPADTAVS